MPCTVFAEGMGWFHKGSNGQGTAPGDVCLSPPPPPAGPVPVPYVNLAFAKDLIKGSKSVKADGNPTALENVSECSMSTGNEPATPGLGAGVVTHKIKGKASFTLWSFNVKVEGKGVCRHGDPMLQNTMCTPPNIVCMAARVKNNIMVGKYKAMWDRRDEGCPKGKEDPPPTKTTKKQRKSVKGKPNCWSCGAERNTGVFASSGRRYNRGRRWTADHQPPQSYVWKYLGGCRNPKLFEKWKKDTASVQPQCAKCSGNQGGSVNSADAEKLLTKLGVLP